MVCSLLALQCVLSGACRTDSTTSIRSIPGRECMHFNFAHARRRPDAVRVCERALEPRAKRREGHFERSVHACRSATSPHFSTPCFSALLRPHASPHTLRLTPRFVLRRTKPGKRRQHRLLQAISRQQRGSYLYFYLRPPHIVFVRAAYPRSSR